MKIFEILYSFSTWYNFTIPTDTMCPTSQISTDFSNKSLSISFLLPNVTKHSLWYFLISKHPKMILRSQFHLNLLRFHPTPTLIVRSLSKWNYFFLDKLLQNPSNCHPTSILEITLLLIPFSTMVSLNSILIYYENSLLFLGYTTLMVL